MLGLFWIIIVIGMIVVVMGGLYFKLFWFELFEYLFYVMFGLIVWNLINVVILDGVEVFVVNEGLIK